MSARNAQQYLREAVESVLGQSFGDFEFLITDDASTDATPDILAEYAHQDRRIVLRREDRNVGLTEALEQMTRMARGDYIARMDADDVSMRLRFEKQVQAFQSNAHVGVLGTWFRLIFADGTPVEEHRYPNNYTWIRERIRGGVNVMCHGSLMFRGEVLRSLVQPVWRFRYGQDFDLHLRLIDSIRYGYVTEILYAHRTHESTMCAEIGATRRALKRLMLDSYDARSEGTEEGDWRAAERAILENRPGSVDAAQRARIACWRGRTAWRHGDILTTRRYFRSALSFGRVGSQAAGLLLGTYIPRALGLRLMSLLEYGRRRTDPRLPFIRKPATDQEPLPKQKQQTGRTGGM